MRGDELDYLLRSANTVLIQCNLHYLWCCILNKDSALVALGVFKEFLVIIVSKRVFRKFHDMLTLVYSVLTRLSGFSYFGYPLYDLERY